MKNFNNLKTFEEYGQSTSNKRFRNKLNEEVPFNHDEYEKYVDVKWTDDEIDTLIKLGADDISGNNIIFIREYDDEEFILSKDDKNGHIEYQMFYYGGYNEEVKERDKNFKRFITDLKLRLSYNGPVRGPAYNGPYAKELVDQWDEEAKERKRYPDGKRWWNF